MKQIVMIHRAFEARWDTLACDGDLFENFHSWWSHFEDLLLAVFPEVVEEGKKLLWRDPAGFANETLTRWCLAADANSSVLFEVENHYDWRDVLRDLENVARSEISPEDLGYSPVPKLCLAAISTLPVRSRALRWMLSQMHPHLTQAVKSVLAGESCATVDEAVSQFPVLRGLTNAELNSLRGNRAFAEVAAARELLCVRLTNISESSVDRYFRPKEFLRI